MVFANAGSFAHGDGTTWGREGESLGVQVNGYDGKYLLQPPHPPSPNSLSRLSPPPSPTMPSPDDLQRMPNTPSMPSIPRPQTASRLPPAGPVRANTNLAHRPSLRKKMSEPSRLGQLRGSGPPQAAGAKQPSDWTSFSDPAVPPRKRWPGRSRSRSNEAKLSSKSSEPSPPLKERVPATPQMPPAFARLSRERGASFTSQKSPGSQPNAQIPLRPANSVSEFSSGNILQQRYRSPYPQSSNYRPERGQSPRNSNYSTHRREAMSRSRHDGYNDDEVRASFRSALTTTSSFLGSGTERSSILTKSSCTSEFYANGNNGPGFGADTTDEGMSVDDAIGMYANGFDDDSDAEGAAVDGSHETNEQGTHSERALAEAMDGEIGDYISRTDSNHPPIRPSTAVSISTNFPAMDTPPMSPPLPSTVMVEPRDRRDRYGFRKATQYVNLDQYEAWSGPYKESINRRRKKWVALMKESGLSAESPARFPPKSAKVKRYIRKGIPPEWRGAAWFWYAGGHTRLLQHPGLYDKLVQQAARGEISEGDVELIERDLNRTFPDNIKFKPDLRPPTQEVKDEKQSEKEPQETKIIKSLRRVLQAFSIYVPRIGYCQSLNFLAGLLLLFMNEEKSFWMLYIITQVYLPGTHEVNLEGANVDLGVLMTSVRESLPAVWAKIGGELDGGMDPDNEGKGNGSPISTRLPPITLCTTAWFMSCFIGNLPIETVLRVWDVFFYEGSKTLFRIALAIFKTGESQIRAVSDPMEIFQVVQTIPRRLIDASALMEACYKRRNGFGHLSQETIDERRRERREMYAEERRRVSAAAASGREVEDDVGQRGKGEGTMREMLRRADSRLGTLRRKK